MEYGNKDGYAKRPLWQWIALYVVIGGVLYVGVYYFFFAGKGGYNYNAPTYSPSTNTTYGTQPQNATAPAPSQTTPPAPSSPTPVAPAAPQPVSISISNFAFSPSQISVKAGTKVTWTNNDSASHTVTSNNGAFGSGTLGTGATYSFVFKTPGTYSYHCAIHPSMTATVVVTQ